MSGGTRTSRASRDGHNFSPTWTRISYARDRTARFFPRWASDFLSRAPNPPWACPSRRGRAYNGGILILLRTPPPRNRLYYRDACVLRNYNNNNNKLFVIYDEIYLQRFSWDRLRFSVAPRYYTEIRGFVFLPSCPSRSPVNRVERPCIHLPVVTIVKTKIEMSEWTRLERVGRYFIFPLEPIELERESG